MFGVNMILPAITPKIRFKSKNLLHVKLIAVDSTNKTFLFNINLKRFHVISILSETRNDQTENDIHENLVDYKVKTN